MSVSLAPNGYYAQVPSALVNENGSRPSRYAKEDIRQPCASFDSSEEGRYQDCIEGIMGKSSELETVSPQHDAQADTCTHHHVDICRRTGWNNVV